MEATARVLAVGNGRARLACEEHASCGSCGPGRGCALRWLGRPRSTTLDVPDRTDDLQPLLPGQAVTIGVRDGDILRAAAMVYLPPLAGLLAGALIGYWAGGAVEGVTLVTALLGAATGWLLARTWSRRSPPRVSVRRAPEGLR